MSRLGFAAILALNLKNSIKRFLHRDFSRLSPLSCQTLDVDDVLIAKKYLKNKLPWYDADTVRKFEREFARWNGSRHAYAFSSGRAALNASVHALGLTRGDEVIVPGYTCVVVRNVFENLGIKVIYGDIELETYGLDINDVRGKVTYKTKAILLHHLYGLVCRDYSELIDFSRENGFFVIEDCAHSTGAEYKGKKVGTYGDVSFYSSEMSKVFNTVMGGVAVTENNKIALRLKEVQESSCELSSERIEKILKSVVIAFYQVKKVRQLTSDLYRFFLNSDLVETTVHDELEGIVSQHGMCKMSAPIAALGLNQLSKIDDYNRKRLETASLWGEWCKSQGVRGPLVVQGSRPVFLRYPVLVPPEKKENHLWAKQDVGIQLGEWFVGSLHPLRGCVAGCPNAEIAIKQCVNFPTILNEKSFVGSVLMRTTVVS